MFRKRQTERRKDGQEDENDSLRDLYVKTGFLLIILNHMQHERDTDSSECSHQSVCVCVSERFEQQELFCW